MIRPLLYLTISLILAFIASLGLSGCSSTPPHRGLSEDGYHFINNGPTLPPPPHLLQKT